MKLKLLKFINRPGDAPDAIVLETTSESFYKTGTLVKIKDTGFYFRIIENTIKDKINHYKCENYGSWKYRKAFIDTPIDEILLKLEHLEIVTDNKEIETISESDLHL